MNQKNDVPSRQRYFCQSYFTFRHSLFQVSKLSFTVDKQIGNESRLEVTPVKFCNFLDLPPARNCRQPTQRQQNCSWARFWHGQMMRDPIQLSAPLRSVELFSGIQGGHINFQLESISPAWIFTDYFLLYKKHVGGIFKASFLLFKYLFIWLQNPKSNSQFIYFHLLHTYLYLQFSYQAR